MDFSINEMMTTPMNFSELIQDFGGIDDGGVGSIGQSSNTINLESMMFPNEWQTVMPPAFPPTPAPQAEAATINVATGDVINTANNDATGGGDGQGASTRRGKRRHQRHSMQQIQVLEAFFKRSPHPDENKRKEMACALGLDPAQIKFWFQNKRTQVKTQNERTDNSQIRIENQKLRIELLRYKQALANATCAHCGGPSTVQLPPFDLHSRNLENARLRDEVDRVSSLTAKYASAPSIVLNCSAAGTSGVVPPHAEGPTSSNVAQCDAAKIYGINRELIRTITGPTEVEKPVVTEVALSAMDELVQMAQLDQPLWFPRADQWPGSSSVVLDKQQYLTFFTGGVTPVNNVEGFFRFEASRDSAVVKINYKQLVEAFMNADQWSNIFSNIVAKAVTIDVLSIGVAGNYDGALQVMYAEFRVLSPQVGSRSFYFVRYCKKQFDGSWAIVDVSLDRYLNTMNRVGRCFRLPSGCLIQESPNGYSKVTWVEHNEVDSDGNESNIYRLLVETGIAFGANRWLATLDRHCERLACAISIIIPPPANDHFVIITPEGKKGILKLAERMVGSYIGGVSCSIADQWKIVSGTGVGCTDVRIMIRKTMNEPGLPTGVLLCAATGFWLPIHPSKVFEFLQDECTRAQWDILSSSSRMTEVARIAYGRETSSCVTLLKDLNPSQNRMMILQESSWDPTGSFVIYAPVETQSMNLVYRGGDTKYIALLPSGFAILPDGMGGNGVLLTVAFQILVDTVPTASLSPESVETVNRLIAGTIQKIKSCLCEHAPTNE